MLLSVVVPAFNEEKTIGPLLDELIEVLDHGLESDYEIVVVDDGSVDATAALAEAVGHPALAVTRLPQNLGKGAAVQHGISSSSGKYVLVQDADVEYSPRDIPVLLADLAHDHPMAVYGSRVLGARALSNGLRARAGLWPRQGIPQRGANVVLQALLRVRFGVVITDPLTGYKLYPRDVFSDWSPTSKGFETDHEITLHLLTRRIPILEVPVRYSPRSRSEGKKIRATDFLRALRVVLRREVT